MKDVTPIVDKIFSNAERIIEQLGEQNAGQFTLQQFIRKVMEDQQHAYVELLAANCHRSAPFLQANQHIENRLNSIAQRVGYLCEEPSGEDQDLFGNLTNLVLYRRQ